MIFSKEDVLYHDAVTHAISQHSTPGNTTVSLINCECSIGHFGPAQTQGESASLAQGWQLHTSGSSSRRSEYSAMASLDPYLMRYLCLDELELLWDNDYSEVCTFLLS